MHNEMDAHRIERSAGHRELVHVAMPDLAIGGAGGFENDRGDQQFHVDYGTNSLVVPPRTPAPDAVAGLLYYDSIDEAGAPTHAAKARPGELTTYDDQLAPYNPCVPKEAPFAPLAWAPL